MSAAATTTTTTTAATPSGGGDGAETADRSVATVAELNLYPIKSCQAVSVRSVVVDRLGLAGDRRLMLVDGGDRFLHQRKFPRLATVTAVMADDGSDTLHLAAPGQPELSVAVCREPRADRPVRQVTVWQSTLPAVDQGDEAAAWFAAIFEASASFARLVALPRLGSPACVPRPITFPPSLPDIPNRQVAFADKGSVLAISEASLADLNARFQAGWQREVPMSRFRPNIVVAGGAGGAFDEDRWLVVQIGAVPFMAYDKATRCKMTAVDQETGETDKIGPLEVLRTYRAPHGPAFAEFGQFLVPLQVGGTINVGDQVKVLEYKKSAP